MLAVENMEHEIHFEDWNFHHLPFFPLKMWWYTSTKIWNISLYYFWRRRCLVWWLKNFLCDVEKLNEIMLSKSSNTREVHFSLFFVLFRLFTEWKMETFWNAFNENVWCLNKWKSLTKNILKRLNYNFQYFHYQYENASN